MKAKCKACKKKFDISENRSDKGKKYYCSKKCEDIAAASFLRAIFEDPKIEKQEESLPTEEELAFLEAELNLIIKDYGLEESEEAVNRLLELISKMIKEGKIKNNPEGIGKVLGIIFAEDPDLKYHFDKFIDLLNKKIIMDIKQSKKLH